MLCSTLEGGVIRPGIQLWQDAPDRCFVHVRPDLWMPVRADLLNCADPAHIERVDGHIVLHRASVQVIANHVMEFIPETGDTASQACVLANIDNGVVRYAERAPKPDFEFCTCMGLNFYARPIGTRRVTKAADSSALAFEEYSMVVAMNAGDYVNLQVIHNRVDRAGQCDPWVEGTFLRYDGQAVSYQPLEARPLAERFSRRCA